MKKKQKKGKEDKKNNKKKKHKTKNKEKKYFLSQKPISQQPNFYIIFLRRFIILIKTKYFNAEKAL